MAEYIVEMNKASVAIYDRYALRPTNLNIPIGQKIALIGKSRSGKTTLLRLLAGFYMAYGGEMTIDGYKPGKETKAITSFIGDMDAIPYELTLETTADIYDTFFYDFDKDKFFDFLDKYGIDRKKMPRHLEKTEAQEAGIFLFLSRDAKLYIMDQYREENEISDWFSMMEEVVNALPKYSTLLFTATDEQIVRKYSDHIIYFGDREVLEYMETEKFLEKYGSVYELIKSEDDYEDYEDNDEIAEDEELLLNEPDEEGPDDSESLLDEKEEREEEK